MQLLRGDVVRGIEQLFQNAQLCVKSAFRGKLESIGWEIQDGEDGPYLMKRRNRSMAWMCVHGGSSCSLVFVIDGKRVVTANVGDSSVLMGRMECGADAKCKQVTGGALWWLSYVTWSDAKSLTC